MKYFIAHHSYFFVHDGVPVGGAGGAGAGCGATSGGWFGGVVSGGVGGIGPSMRKVSVLLTTTPCQAAGPADAGRL
jgi:hypothetical protein